VIRSEREGHCLSSHCILSPGTHSGAGSFGPASGRTFAIRLIADCGTREGVIDHEWPVRDNGALVRQMADDRRSPLPRSIFPAPIPRKGIPMNEACIMPRSCGAHSGQFRARDI